jgi:hypothetical protein
MNGLDPRAERTNGSVDVKRATRGLAGAPGGFGARCGVLFHNRPVLDRGGLSTNPVLMPFYRTEVQAPLRMLNFRVDDPLRKCHISVTGLNITDTIVINPARSVVSVPALLGNERYFPCLTRNGRCCAPSDLAVAITFAHWAEPFIFIRN